jgi:5-formyltetrahydrofolate cyclo-ligase
MQGKAKPLLFRAWRPGDALETRMWGIREPSADQALLRPDVLLVPLLAFDRDGWRLGYGGGFYDRTLRDLRAAAPSVAAIGLAFDPQEVDAVPHLDYDEPLDMVLTPTRLLQCRS